ncbi:T-cell surface antigen CD2-like isoform X2 [Cyclopterus lumpus]|uniref:Ig-like domain-containing protein n=1 Tax=Cyclopterus lumpus TaxID=8103 RepID=A0A8C3G1E0_CYCLU|nr:T-cell surface antigen CD2-like isoform X2 [Cyclopterus lumpus]
MRRRMKVKMASVSSVSLLLLCCSAISSAGSKETCDLYAATGADFTVPVVAAVHRMDTLIWKHDGELIFSRRKESTFLKGRKEDVSEDGSLKLTNVQKSHEGSYVSEVFDTDGKKKGPFEAKHLCVMHGVPTPSVTSTCNASSKVTFTCKVTPKDKDLRFAWLQNDKVLEKEKGPILTTSLDLVKTDPISCKVSNLASSVTSAPVTHDCKANTSFLPETLLGINTWIFVGTGGGVVLVLIVVVVVCCVCTKRRKRLRLKEEGELRLAWTNDEEPHCHPPGQHPHHLHQHPQQPAGHTGPRQHRHRAPDHANADARPQPSPRRSAQATRPPGKIDEEQPPPLPQPRKNTAKTPRV